MLSQVASTKDNTGLGDGNETDNATKNKSDTNHEGKKGGRKISNFFKSSNKQKPRDNQNEKNHGTHKDQVQTRSKTKK